MELSVLDGAPALARAAAPERVRSTFQLRPPVVSVVISNYNYGRFLRDAVDSVRSQTYEAVECLVVDDCSTDGSAAILADLEAEDDQLKVIRLPVNSGQTAAALEGLARARGDFVLFLDADDVLFPECISRHLALHMSSRRAVGFSCCNAVQMFDDGRIIGRWATLSASFMRLPADPTLISPDASASITRQGVALPAIDPARVRYVPWSNTEWPWTSTSSMFFRRDALELVCGAEGLRDMRIGTDNYFANAINHLTGSLLLDETLVGYRLHGTNNFNKRPALDNFFCHNREDAHYHATRRLILDDLMLRFSHYAANMNDPAHIFRVCRLLDLPDRESGLPRWAAQSRFSRLVAEQRQIWRRFFTRGEVFGLIVSRCLPFPWHLRSPRAIGRAPKP